MTTPVCIIGAGPAGFSTAFHLAKAGIACTLVDKNQSPRTKTCGDILTSICVRELRELFPDFTERVEMNQFLGNSKGVVIHTPNYHYFPLTYKNNKETNEPVCYSLKRSDLDTFLSKEAHKNPFINFIENFSVQTIEQLENSVRIIEKGQNQVIETPLVIIAAGSTTPFTRQLINEKRDKKHYAVGLRAYYKGVEMTKEGYADIFIRKNIPVGAMYITPFHDEVVNVNFAIRSDVVEQQKINLKTLFKDLLENDPNLKGRFKNAELVGKIEGSGLKLGTKTRQVSGDNFLLTGDAAGLIDILSANGLPQAFISGRMTSEFAVRAIAEENYSADFLKEYDEKLWKRIEGFIKTGKALSPYLNKKWYQFISFGILNFFAKHASKSDVFRDLLFDSKAKHNLLKPAFYFKMFLKSKREGVAH